MKKEVRRLDFPSLAHPPLPRPPIEVPLRQGPARITGAVFDSGSRWLVTTDLRGWAVVALLSVPDHAWVDFDQARVLARIAEENADATRAADLIRHALGSAARAASLGIVRVAPCGRLVELLNVSLPTVFQWDPEDGVSSYERCQAALGPVLGHRSEILRLTDGTALVLTTAGLLPVESCFREILHFTRSTGIDPLGGTLADTEPAELQQVVRGSWHRHRASAAMVVIGVPAAHRYRA